MTQANATWDGSTLVLSTGAMVRTLRVDATGLRDAGLVNPATGQRFEAASGQAVVELPGEADATDWQCEQADVAATDRCGAHRAVTVTHRRGELHVQQVFRLFAGVPAVAMELSLRGKASASRWRSAAEQVGTAANVETLPTSLRGGFQAPVMETVTLPDPHVRVTAVRFHDITDLRNTLVQREDVLPYRFASRMAGNLLLVRATLRDAGFALLKTAPCSDVQLADAGCDFLVNTEAVRVTGIGVDPGDVDVENWTPCYGCVLVVGHATEASLLDSLRLYQHASRLFEPKRDFQIMVNTWGDRSQDARLGEAFALAELDACAKLGATHFMLDDGWQSGRTTNSALGGGTLDGIWSRGDYWSVDPRKFPNGLQPIVEKAESLGIQLCLWFAPARDGDYQHWQQDADALVELYRQHRVDTFKIDMIDVATKRSELNLRAFFDRVIDATSGAVTFCLDATAKRRFGYHMLRHVGNVFLENRYTDWSNYRPHWTLRNLWMLARYVPIQFVQAEFLNVWRNAGKYPADDPLAPAKVPFDYCFALTMFAQPLGWFEASNLPPEAFNIAPLLQTYRTHASAIHAGRILPLGDEPVGSAWTGFQSHHRDGTGYLLLLRQLNESNTATLTPWHPLPEGCTLERLAASGEDATLQSHPDGRLIASQNTTHSYSLWRYTGSGSGR